MPGIKPWGPNMPRTCRAPNIRNIPDSFNQRIGTSNLQAVFSCPFRCLGLATERVNVFYVASYLLEMSSEQEVFTFSRSSFKYLPYQT